MTSNRPVRVNHRKGANRSAITMIDMIVTILLISIVSALTIPRMSETLDRHRLESSAHSLVHHIEYLRKRAIVSGTELTFRLLTNPPGIECTQLPMPNQPGETFWVDLSAGGIVSGLSASELSSRIIRIDRFGEFYDASGKLDQWGIQLSIPQASADIQFVGKNASIELEQR